MCELHAIQAGVARVLQCSISFDHSLANACMTVHILCSVKYGSHVQHSACLHAMLQAVGWMREQWVQGLNAVLADEKGLGRTATVITFLQCLR